MVVPLGESVFLVFMVGATDGLLKELSSSSPVLVRELSIPSRTVRKLIFSFPKTKSILATPRLPDGRLVSFADPARVKKASLIILGVMPNPVNLTILSENDILVN